MKKTLVFAALFACIATTHAQFWKGKSASSKEVSYITVHPAPIVLKGEAKEKGYFFFLTDEGFFFTENEELANKITNHVPVMYTAGKAVKIEGSPLRAFTKFKKKQLAEVSKRTGEKINKRDDVFIITGYSFLDDYDQKKTKPSGTMKYTSPPKKTVKSIFSTKSFTMIVGDFFIQERGVQVRQELYDTIQTTRVVFL